MPKKIVQKDASILRRVAEEVLIKDINSPKIQKVISEMKEALASQDDGVAIAAPQIGCSLRIFVVSGKIEGLIKNRELELRGERLENDFAKSKKKNSSQDLIFINPVIKKLSKEKVVVEEGCLSVRYLYGKVSRAKKATIEAYDEKGKKFTKGGSGILSQIFQHEVDHLNGVLFIDKAKYVEEILPINAATTRKS